MRYGTLQKKCSSTLPHFHQKGQIHPGAENELKAPTDPPGSSHSTMFVYVSFCL